MIKNNKITSGNSKALVKTKDPPSIRTIRNKGWKKFSKYFALVNASLLVLALVTYLIFQVLARTGHFGVVPSLADLKQIEQYNSSELYAEGGELLGKYFIYDRTSVKLDEISSYVVPALVSTEDERFYKHSGTDYISLPRVIFKTILLGDKSTGGGSTITRQLAKNLYPRQQKGFLWLVGEKIREGIIASRLEKTYTKDEILAFYLNTVPFGENVFGISASSQRFFRKNPGQLNIEEVATLVGMLKATTALNPRTNPVGSHQRRNVVLSRMEKKGFLSANQADSLRSLPLVIDYNPFSHVHGPAPYLREKIRHEVAAYLQDYNSKNGTNYNLYTDGLKIFTTIDYNLQTAAERVHARQMKRLQQLANNRYATANKNNVATLLDNLWKSSTRYRALRSSGKSLEDIKKASETPIQTLLFDWDGGRTIDISPLDSVFEAQKIVHGAILSLDAETGQIKAYVGGNNIRFFQFDLVSSYRQAGSTFKPFIYAAAIESGTSPCEMVSTEAPVFEAYDNWSPQNHDDNYEGYYSMKGAMAHSVNTVSAKYIIDCGFENAISLARNAGFKGRILPVPSISLGTAEVSLMELTNAFAIFRNRGMSINSSYLTRIETISGKVLYEANIPQENVQVISEETALIVNHLLEGVVNEGTGSSIRARIGQEIPLAGKTGTTQKNSDSWFVGYSPGLITGVWVGLENPAFNNVYPLPFGASSSAVHIWSDLYDEIRRDSRTRKYVQGSFNPLTQELVELLDCPSFLLEVPEPSLLEKIFGTDREYFEKREEESKRKGLLRRLFEKIF